MFGHIRDIEVIVDETAAARLNQFRSYNFNEQFLRAISSFSLFFIQ